MSVNTANRSGVIRLDILTPVSIYNNCEVAFSPSYSSGQTYTIQHTGPAVQRILALPADPMHGPVSSLEVTFSGPINLASFTYQDIALSRDGNAVALNATIDTSAVSGSTYRINNLAVFTGEAGTYSLTVNGNGITDQFGNAATGTATVKWYNLLPGNQALYVSFAYAGTNSNGSLENPFTTVTAGYAAAQASNTMTVFNGNYPETILMNKRLILLGTNGPVKIGTH